MKGVQQNADRPDGGSPAQAMQPTLSQKNMMQLNAMNATRAAQGMSSTQGPHNKGGASNYSKNTMSPRTG
jgi:hypothetical protein